jgi:large subunit ribosomal protein L6
MSRVGRRPIEIPKGVSVTLDGKRVTVKGPKGELGRTVHAEMRVAVENDVVQVSRPSDVGRHRALHGLTRALIANMVHGVSTGFSKQLEIQGVGYRAETQAGGLKLQVGFSHPVQYKAPPGIKLSVENNTVVTVEGIDKEVVGQVAADLRAIRPPEPYKGKGIRYRNEQVRRKAGKTGAKA